MRVLLVTVAGLSSRFSESLGYDYLKCLYYERDIRESLLCRLLFQDTEFDRYIIVGGFQFDKLEQAIQGETVFDSIREKITLVYNAKYNEYGSGYSLYIGLLEAIHLQAHELVFAEGDLHFAGEGFQEVAKAQANVLTYTSVPIWANRAVAFYYDLSGQIHYIYDPAHCALRIDEPFQGIFNSGQVWKFYGEARLKKTLVAMGPDAWQGTNLVFIQNYFAQLAQSDYRAIELRDWINCNTISDFHRINKKDERNENNY